MYALHRFHGAQFDRVNAIIDSLSGHITGYINLIGSASLPLPEVCLMEGMPAAACRTEGHRDARLFPATAPIDLAEELAEERMRVLFGVGEEYAISTQPHSATQANQVIFAAKASTPGAGIMGLGLKDGGHISHRSGLFPGSVFSEFSVTTAGIDYQALERTVLQLRPVLLVAGGTSYPLSIDFPRLREIADSVGAHLHADLAHTAPYISGGQHPPAFPFVDSATFDMSKGLRGPRGGILVYRQADRTGVRRALFPVLQSSPNQAVLLAKAACLASWTREGLHSHAARMVRMARILAKALEPILGQPVFGGTESHLLIFDLSGTGMLGHQAELMLERKRVLVNRNLVPGDGGSPWAPSGIRLASTVPAILQYDDDDVIALGTAIGHVLQSQDHSGVVDRLLARYHRNLVSTANEPTGGASSCGKRPT